VPLLEHAKLETGCAERETHVIGGQPVHQVELRQSDNRAGDVRMPFITRRRTLALAVGGAFAAIWRAATPVRADANEAAAEIAKFTGGQSVEAGKIAIDLPEIAENGNAVPLGIVVDHPMTPENYISDILVVAAANPRPRLVTMHLTPLSGRAQAATRIRLAATQNVVVLAKSNSGKIYRDQKEVKITIGGCGG